MKVFRVAVLALVAVGLAGPALAEGEQEFTLHNGLGVAIAHAKAREVGSTGWVEVLEPGPIDPGQVAKVTMLDAHATQCHYALEFELQDGKRWLIQDLDLCATTDLTVKREGQTVVYSQQ